MKYILSEEEYNTLQSRIQSLESVNKELQRDLVGTERTVRNVEVSSYIEIVGEIARNANFKINSLGTVTPAPGCIVTFPNPCPCKYVDNILHIEGIIDNLSVWIPANIFVGIANLGTVNDTISAKGAHYLREIVPLLGGRTVVCKSTFRRDFKFGFDYIV
jgi:hypothetical protein